MTWWWRRDRRLARLWAQLLAAPAPDPRRWALVREHHRPSRDELLDAAFGPDGHPVVEFARGRLVTDADAVDRLCAAALDRPALAEWCAAEGLVPGDPATAAALLLLSGRHEQYRAMDPDGELLRAAFTVATPWRRPRLLRAVADAGDLDPVAVAAQGHGSRLVWDLPLAEALAAVARLGGWRPARRADADLFELLAGGDADELAAAAEWLAQPLEVFTDGTDGHFALSPDGTRLVLEDGRGSWDLVEVDLATGERTRMAGVRIAVPGPADASQGGRRLLHLGDAVISVGRRGVHRCGPAGGAAIVPDFYAIAVTPCAGGFAVLARDGTVLRATPDGVLWTSGAATGLVEAADGLTRRSIAVAPDGRHVALGLGERIALLDADGKLRHVHAYDGDLDSFMTPEYEGVVCIDNDRLVTLATIDEGDAELTRWRVTDEGLEREQVLGLRARRLDVLDGTGLLAVGEEDEPPRYLDAATFEERTPPGRYAVRTDDHRIEVRRPAVYALAGRPLSALAPGDAAALDAALAAGPQPRAAPVLRLLRESLRIRYGTDDIALGGVREAGDTDIVLGGRS